MVSGGYQMCQETGKSTPALPAAQLTRARQENGGVSPAALVVSWPSKSAQELKHGLLRLVGQCQRRDRDRLAGRQRLAVGRFLVGVGQRQVGRAGLQHVDQVLREVLAD